MSGGPQDLAAAVKTLVPTSVTIAGTTAASKVYDTVVTDAQPPDIYFVANIRVPNVAERSEAARPVSHVCRVAITIGARTAVAVRDMAKAIAALDGTRPAAPGWVTGPLQLRTTRGPDRDPDLTFTNGAPVIYGRLEFDLLASLLPA